MQSNIRDMSIAIEELSKTKPIPVRPSVKRRYDLWFVFGIFVVVVVIAYKCHVFDPDPVTWFVNIK